MSFINVDVNGDILSSFYLEGKNGPSKFKVNDPVTLLFKETEVGIAKNLTGMISLRNRFNAVIKKIEKGTILTRLVLKYKEYDIESVISTRSAVQMKLNVGEEIEWLVKTNEMTIMKEPA
jgi:molybdate transport system regulatory protein